MTDLFCSLKFVPLNLSISFFPWPPSLEATTCSLYLWVCFCYVYPFVLFFRSHVWVKAWSICFSLSDLFHLALYLLGPSVLLQTARWNCPVLCGSLEGRGVWGEMNTYTYMVESLHCSPDTVTTLLIGIINYIRLYFDNCHINNH